MMIISNKKVVLYAVLFFGIFQLQAKISIDKSDMPAVDDIVCTSTGLNPDFINYQETGEDFNFDVVEVFPVPSFGIVNIIFELLSESDIVICIYNSKGGKVANYTLRNYSPGRVNQKIDLQQLGLESGIYFMRLISNTKQITKKIILY